MKENYSTHQSRIKDLILNLNETKQSLHEIMSQKLKFQEEIENMNSETENLKREKDELKLEIEDLQSDKQIILKKSQNVQIFQFFYFFFNSFKFLIFNSVKIFFYKLFLFSRKSKI